MFIYIAFTLYALSQKSIWVFDGILYSAILTIIYHFSKRFNLSVQELAMLNIGMLLQLAGFFGAYGLNIPFFHYDKIVHFFTMAVVAYAFFKFVDKTLNDKIIRDNAALFIFLVISASITLGLTVEFIEYGGFFVVGNQDNILSPGAGYKSADIYQDTMNDIASNILGAVLGTFIYYNVKYKKKIQ